MQLTIDFDRAEQLGMIERWECPRRPGVSPATCKAVLRAIDGFGRGREAWPSETTLAQVTGVSKRTVIRAIAALTDLSILICSRRGSMTLNHYRIVWTELALLVPGRCSVNFPQSPRELPPTLPSTPVDRLAESAIEPSVAERSDTTPELVSERSDTLPQLLSERSDMVSERSDMVSERSDMVSERSDMVSPKTTSKQNREPTTTRELPVVVVSLLESLGVVRARQALATAIELGIDYQTRIDAYRQLDGPRQNPGTLYNWLTIPRSYRDPRTAIAAPVTTGQGIPTLARLESQYRTEHVRLIRTMRQRGDSEDAIQIMSDRHDAYWQTRFDALRSHTAVTT